MLVLIGGIGYGLHWLRVWRLVAKEKMLKVYVAEAMTKIKVLNALFRFVSTVKKCGMIKGIGKD